VDDDIKAKAVQGVPVLGRVDDIPELTETQEIDEVIVVMPEATHHEILKVVSKCDRASVAIKVFPNVFQIMATEVSIGDLGGLPLLTVRDTALQGWRLTVKRVVDAVGSAVGLVLLSPLMMLLAILIKLESAGPVFYTQERMGLDGKSFMMLKFRSMRADAEAQTGPVWATPDDDRRTRLGAFIRRVSIDELPQLINVLIGDMSLVGPRPERPVFVEQFKQTIPRYMDRHREKAGITGWAQVNGLRGDTSIIERTKYDLWYTENWSLALDFRILARTISNIFVDRNAY
jgi:Undecaprenyl-phosphate glucose phosphotransferase